jgi:hypothetical protein
VTASDSSYASIPGRRPFFQGRSPSNFFPAPSQVQKNSDQETLKHDPHKKEDDRVYGGTPDHLFSKRFLRVKRETVFMYHDLR